MCIGGQIGEAFCHHLPRCRRIGDSTGVIQRKALAAIRIQCLRTMGAINDRGPGHSGQCPAGLRIPRPGLHHGEGFTQTRYRQIGVAVVGHHSATGAGNPGRPGIGFNQRGAGITARHRPHQSRQHYQTRRWHLRYGLSLQRSCPP